MTVTGAFEVKVIPTKEEYPRLVEVLWAANMHPYNPVFTAVHPISGPTAEDRARDKALDTEVRWSASERNPFSRLIYVIDKETGRIAGGCEWPIYHENPFPTGPQPVVPGTLKARSEPSTQSECSIRHSSHDNAGFSDHMQG
ncbi:uncharacterized protein N7483_004671 [Penicillium malachiteum]|uniref:uncharacterized protein n=1 Tax=Penicillium malachiteum TaxID=1324776 RepID=UPI0025481302|nr:uncharacterized protein N7483_004671 [Penicillium malachiteum]KAJ5730163.1 hypothetical protein N7483_004671 [Penicillium malachiteum]